MFRFYSLFYNTLACKGQEASFTGKKEISFFFLDSCKFNSRIQIQHFKY